ncbi:MAG: ImmA/IrrE family metallo-endopeptidase [Proteobacteria bacterium]|nr:ImmA/IrrE family metallo-endopeptidase [Pseudomonadota bacterium]
MPLPFRIPIFSYEQINELAEEFLHEHALGDKFPIPIDEVIEFKYEIDIVPFPNLQRDFDIDGFISGDLSQIYVDDFVFNKRPFRYRFTLAHEIGHLILHKDLIQSIRPNSVAEWEDFIIQVDPEAYEWVEWQAYTFGGLVLVPRKPLKEDFIQQILSLKQKIMQAKLAELPRDSYKEYIIEAIAKNLIEKYEVSRDVLIKRITKEVDKEVLGIP